MKGKTLKRASGGASTANVPNDPTGKFDSDAGPSEVYAGEGSNVVKEARERKKGGKVMGDKGDKRLDRPCRKRGGRATGGGAEANPLTAAHKTSDRPGGDIQSKGGMD